MLADACRGFAALGGKVVAEPSMSDGSGAAPDAPTPVALAAASAPDRASETAGKAPSCVATAGTTASARTGGSVR
ncbi:MAG: hypothetical protein CBB72_016540 [Muricauda sp. TMED12]|nr:MAG: hypothetical protein CBB72_016540 [Muricauda sp. TMED12]